MGRKKQKLNPEKGLHKFSFLKTKNENFARIFAFSYVELPPFRRRDHRSPAALQAACAGSARNGRRGTTARSSGLVPPAPWWIERRHNPRYAPLSHAEHNVRAANARRGEEPLRSLPPEWFVSKFVVTDCSPLPGF